MNPGILAATAAYTIWGLFPLYIKALPSASALELVAHRSLGSLVVVVALLALRHQFGWLRELLARPRVLAGFALSAALLSGNWLLYVWAVSHDRVLDASLGYFITPLVNVLLGFAVLHERPRPVQWLAVGLAAAGVLWMVLGAGHLPWVALALAASFGLYGLLRKTAALGALEGLALETAMQAPLALGCLLWLAAQQQMVFAQGDLGRDALLLAAGPLTALPLLLFAAGARRVTMATLGLLQYLGPTIQFALGVLLYQEPFTPRRAIGFGLIWAALLLYSAEGLLQMRRQRAVAAA